MRVRRGEGVSKPLFLKASAAVGAIPCLLIPMWKGVGGIYHPSQHLTDTNETEGVFVKQNAIKTNKQELWFVNRGVVEHSCHPSTQEAKAGRLP